MAFYRFYIRPADFSRVRFTLHDTKYLACSEKGLTICRICFTLCSHCNP